MRKLTLSMQMSLDGYIEGPAGEMDWFVDDDETWNDMFEFLKSIDTILLGAGMYPEYVDYWRRVLSDPKARPDEVKYSSLQARSNILFSRTRLLKLILKLRTIIMENGERTPG